MSWSEQLAPELAVAIGDGEVWASIGIAILCGGACWMFGSWVARMVGLLDPNAPAGERIAVGLTSGLMVFAAWRAAVWSQGRSSFTPVAIAFALSLALALGGRARRLLPNRGGLKAENNADVPRVTRMLDRRALVSAGLLAGLFIATVALLYASTNAPRPRHGLQPLIERETAFYAILGRDLGNTGTETNLSASGFSDLAGFPTQVWYHWGEMWLSSAVIETFGVAPMAARHFVVLPIILLAAAALAGTLVRRLNHTESWVAFLFGAIVLLFLRPIPVLPGPFFSNWAIGLLAGIRLFGIGATAALLGLYCRAVLRSRQPTWPLAIFVASAAAFTVPAHLAIAVLGLTGLLAAAASRVLLSLFSERRLPAVARIWRRCTAAAALLVGATVLWGTMTGHGLGGSSASPALVTPFNTSWRETIVILLLGSGVFVAVPISWWRLRRNPGPAPDLYVGVMALLVAGAVGWGARLAEFSMFYLLFAGIAAYATPVAATAIWMLRDQLRGSGHLRLTALVVVLCVIQLQIGIVGVAAHLQGIGVAGQRFVPTELLGSIARLPLGAKLAYSCGPAEEIAFGVPQLLTIDAVTARRVIPMCFEPEYPGILVGAKPDLTIPSQFYVGAPQMELYPTSTAKPTTGAILAFLRKYEIGYIYVDARHPNTLVPDAVPVAASGDAAVLRLP